VRPFPPRRAAAPLTRAHRTQQDALTQSIRLLNALAVKLKAARMAAGALNLASPEVKIHLQSAESTGPIDVETKAQRETNSLVEEFMLLANVSVARRIEQAFPATAVLRRHLPPPKANFETLQDILRKRRGLALDVSSSGALAASLDTCVVRAPRAAPCTPRLTARLAGPSRARVQHARAHHGDALHAVRRVLLRGVRLARHVRPLRARVADLHALHEPDPPVRGRARAPAARGRRRARAAARAPARARARRARVGRRESEA
jgi:hypothetical protein